MVDDYLNQTVTLERRTGKDRYGQPAFAAGVALAARVQQRNRLVRNTEGEQVVSDMQVYLAAGTATAAGDRVTYDGATYQVLSVTRAQGLDEETYRMLWTGRAG